MKKERTTKQIEASNFNFAKLITAGYKANLSKVLADIRMKNMRLWFILTSIKYMLDLATEKNNGADIFWRTSAGELVQLKNMGMEHIRNAENALKEGRIDMGRFPNQYWLMAFEGERLMRNNDTIIKNMQKIHEKVDHSEERGNGHGYINAGSPGEA